MVLTLDDRQINPPVLLAPLAGITDLPFRELVSSFGAGLVVSEMVASQEMVEAKPGVRDRAELGFGVENTSVQLAGRDPRWMAEAARMVAAQEQRCRARTESCRSARDAKISRCEPNADVCGDANVLKWRLPDDLCRMMREATR